MNSTTGPFDTTFRGDAATIQVRDTFSTALAKNIIVVFVWLCLSYINGALVLTFFKNQVFYEDPRYILFIHMVINDAVQLTVALTLFVVSYVFFRINVAFCSFFILIAVFTTMNTPLSLAAMAIERYVAICNPLRAVPAITDLFITLAIEPVGFFHSSVFCLRDTVFRAPFLSYKRHAFDGIYFSFVCLTVIYTYLKIMFVAKAANNDAAKARNTILLHGLQLLMCLLSYGIQPLQSALVFIFPSHYVNIFYIIYLLVYILPRFLSPIVYGVRDQNFRKYLKQYFVCKGGGYGRAALSESLYSLSMEPLLHQLRENLTGQAVHRVLSDLQASLSAALPQFLGRVLPERSAPEHELLLPTVLVFPSVPQEEWVEPPGRLLSVGRVTEVALHTAEKKQLYAICI
ncbi:odorant receptor 131-2-like [Acipenser ruthenus]|uniref:odorant receptor 131-2-like n=1 Tax=Acipenser ruthenus TaxID=7906 RepID=UPI0027404B19|nr:odorant receptor 131-2-like [Acipenser ruthenus]